MKLFPWSRKQPEKPKPNFIGEQHEHKACLIVFANTKAATRLNELKRQYAKTTVIQQKPAIRLKTMINECKKITYNHRNLQTSCITSINTASSYNEMIAMQIGLIKPSEPQGFAICPGCLQQAILACEEVLISLKDIQEATKEYV